MHLIVYIEMSYLNTTACNKLSAACNGEFHVYIDRTAATIPGIPSFATVEEVVMSKEQEF
jgi:hypothetical protein